MLLFNLSIIEKSYEETGNPWNSYNVENYKIVHLDIQKFVFFKSPVIMIYFKFSTQRIIKIESFNTNISCSFQLTFKSSLIVDSLNNNK